VQDQPSLEVQEPDSLVQIHPSLEVRELASLVQVQPSVEGRDQDRLRASVWKSVELVLILERRVVSPEVRVASERAVWTVPFSVIPENQFRVVKHVDLGLIPVSRAASGAQEAVPERQVAARTVLMRSTQERVFVDLMRAEAEIVPLLLPDRNQIH
jgi:hypothetical protein